MKAIKIIGIIIVICVALAVGSCFVISGIMNHRNENSWKYAETKGKIETQYTAFGIYEVSTAEWSADGKAWRKYEVWYPAEMKESNDKYPLVIMVNGTGVKASQYQTVFRHLASWGFIVAGNEDENSRTGESSAASLDFMLGLNEDENSDFYGKIDTDNIGIAGHSQGGVGAMNAVTEQANGNMYRAVWTASATSRYHADEMNKSADGWSCAPSEIHIPCFMTAGTRFFDAGNVEEYTVGKLTEGSAQGICPLWWLDECYNAIPEGVDKVIARKVNADHGDMLRGAAGYMTAWFLYWLKDDMEAGNAFFGKNAEILKNNNWQDVKVDGQV